ncbi:PilZ domain-containing protein [Acutalibacter intestini]|uniref:PilZ domain-containing protein n=1 Tax=Acutalibacter intestini TaxID=3093659 RepID=UPI002AC95E51|nr:PilZ domain-containing protein [Acutalibacter sp. M00204]
MGLLDLFKKKEKAQPPQESEAAQEKLSVYSGMRVEVTTDPGQFLFVAKLLNPQGDQAELHQYSESEIREEAESIRAKIRGYSDYERKAVSMEGIITPGPQHIWRAEELTVVHVGNDRAFFRLEINREATMATFSGLETGEKPCKLLNISVGGARVSAGERYHEGDKFLLKVRLLEDRPESALFAQVVRVIEKDPGKFEYGCRFIGMTEADQEQITKNIFAAQRQKKGRA